MIFNCNVDFIIWKNMFTWFVTKVQNKQGLICICGMNSMVSIA